MQRVPEERFVASGLLNADQVGPQPVTPSTEQLPPQRGEPVLPFFAGVMCEHARGEDGGFEKVGWLRRELKRRTNGSASTGKMDCPGTSGFAFAEITDEEHSAVGPGGPPKEPTNPEPDLSFCLPQGLPNDILHP